MMDYSEWARFLILFYGLKGWQVSCETGIQCEVRVRIDTGWICGKRLRADNGGEYASFRGIPYATQPVGKLRFQELQPASPWNHYLDATEERSVCPQHDEVYGRLMKPLQGMSEACIYVNVHVPLEELTHEYDITKKSFAQFETERVPFKDLKIEYGKTEKSFQTDGGKANKPFTQLYTDGVKGLPILVYIHGGAFRSGSGDTDLNGAEYLVSRGVIVITFNYRLNVFGFLSLNSVEVPGNQGLRDQVTLLRWVQRNARAFGGDPHNVTLMGQSAGATYAHILSLSKAADGLFKRVILSSGTANRGYYTASPLYSKAVAALFLTQLDINSTNPEEVHSQLTTIPLERILLANSKVQYMTGLITFAPVIESPFPGVTRVLDEDPTILVKIGRGNKYPIMIGFNTAECGYFRPLLEYLDFKSRIEANPTMLLSPSIVFETSPAVSLQLARQAIRKYFKDGFTYDEYERSCTETLFQYPSLQLANIRASMKRAPAFLYQFAYKSLVNLVQEAAWLKNNGTVHIEDFVRIFKANAFIDEIGMKKLSLRDEQIKDWMTKFVVNFMRCSNPTCTPYKSRSPWPAVQQGLYNYQQIEQPGVYRNRGPTREQWDLITFNEYVEADSRKSVLERGTLVDGTSVADVLVNNITAQFSFQRPRYPLAIVYRPKIEKKARFKLIDGVKKN